MTQSAVDRPLPATEAGILPRWSTAADRAIEVFCVAIVVISAALILTFDYGRDQGIYGLVARTILEGGMPYRDAFDFKPPGIFVVYAIARALFGPAQVGIRVLEAAAMVATAVGLVRLSTKHFGSRRVGLVAAALASQIHVQLDFWHTAQPETFGGTLTVWALVLASRANDPASSRRRALMTWIAAGVLFGASGLMKPPLAGAGAAVALLATVQSILRARAASPSSKEQTSRGRALAWSAMPLLGMALGGVVPFLATLGWFLASGALGDLHEVLFVFTPHYTKISWQETSVLPMAYYGLVEWLTTYSSSLLAGLIALVAFRPNRSELPFVLVLVAAVFVHIAGIVMQGKFFPYHWGATFPLSAMLAALGLDKAWGWSKRFGPAGAVSFLVIFAIIATTKVPVPSFGEAFAHRTLKRFDLFVRGPLDQVERDGLASVADVNAGENRAVAAYLTEHTAPGSHVFVWGFEPVIYDLADRPSSTRYIYNVPQRAAWSAEPMQRALMAELERTPPAAIVVEHNDVFPMVTGNRDDSARSLLTFDALSRKLSSEYDLVQRIGDFDVYLRATP